MPHQTKEGMSYLQQGGTIYNPYSITFLMKYSYTSGIGSGVDPKTYIKGACV